MTHNTNQNHHWLLQMLEKDRGVSEMHLINDNLFVI